MEVINGPALTDLMVGAVVMPLSVDFLYHSWMPSKTTTTTPEASEEAALSEAEGGRVEDPFWRHGKAACFFWLVTDTVVCTSSIWNLVAIAADRLTVRTHLLLQAYF